MLNDGRRTSGFQWDMISDNDKKQFNSENRLNNSIYRLMKYNLRRVMIHRYGIMNADEIFFDAGRAAGKSFYSSLEGGEDTFDAFASRIQELFDNLDLGSFAIEKIDLERMRFTILMSKSPDCTVSGLSGENLCSYDEGFIEGLLSSYTGMDFRVKDVDCRNSGEGICRFIVEGEIPGSLDL